MLGQVRRLTRVQLASGLILLAMSAVLVQANWHQIVDLVSDEKIITLRTRAEFLSLQGRIQEASSRVMPSVVAIEEAGATSPPVGSSKARVSRRFASGVIISSDGLILSQFHVSHLLAWKPGESVRSRQPGERTTVVLSDGRRIEAKLLGADETYDLSLLRLLEPGPFPYSPLDSSSKVGLGDWVLKLGHPTGYRRDRSPVVRLGRVLFRNSDIFVTDCMTTGGDSGGPFFDLQGRLVGIIHSNDTPAKLRDSLTSLSPKSARIGPFSSTTTALIQKCLKKTNASEITPFDQKRQDRFTESYRRVADDELLPQGQWTQGILNADAFKQILINAQKSVTMVLDEAGYDVAHGTIVESDGWIVTVASTLPANPRCRLSDSRVVAAEVVGIDPAFDMALLKVNEIDLSPMKWTQKPAPHAGAILAAAGMSEVPLAIGVVSVSERNLPGPFPIRISRADARPPRLLGKSTSGGYLVNGAGGEAHVAGIRPGDVIRTIAGRDIGDDQDLLDSSRGYVEGERATVGLLRGDQQRDVILEFAAETRRRVDIPTLFEHDMPLSAAQCGGPVVDLGGEAVGITIYRSEYGCIAVPGERIKQLLPTLKSCGITDRWVKPRSAALDKLSSPADADLPKER